MEKFIKKGQIIVGLDFDNAKSAFEITKLLNPKNYKLKVGSQLFTSCGPKILDDLNKEGFDIFLDLKFHDTPNTVEKAVLEACKMSIWMLNIHLSGGLNMIEAAVKAKNSISPEILLIGVTVLTSLNSKSLKEIGHTKNVKQLVIKQAALIKKSGCDGIVCSPQEAMIVRKKYKNLLIITPGIRLLGESSNDQKRIMTPKQAFENKVSGIVIGRSLILGNIKKNIIRLIDNLNQ